MNRETLYASLAGCAGFIVVALGSYWYFSPPKPVGDAKMPVKSVPANSASVIPAATNGPAPVPVQPVAPGNAFPATVPSGVAPSRPAPPAPSVAPTPTAYGASMDAGQKADHPSPAATSLSNDEERYRSYRARTPSSQAKQNRISPRAERQRRRASDDDE